MKSIKRYLTESYSSTTDIQPQTKRELQRIIQDSFDNGEYDLNFIDTSRIKDMSELFMDIDGHEDMNFDVSDWDVSNVRNMSYMFDECKEFNCDISYWDVSNVTNMEGMFNYCESLDCDLSEWDTRNVETMIGMFNGADLMCLPDWYYNKDIKFK